MKIKATVAALAIAAGVAQPVNAVIPVFVDFDLTATINQIETMAQWATQLESMATQIEQAKALVSEAKTMKAYAGNPGDAVRSLISTAGIDADLSTSIGSGSSLSGSLNFLASLEAGGVSISLVPTTASEAATDDSAMAAFRDIIRSDGTSTTAPSSLFTALDSAETIARAVKKALVGQNATRAKAVKALAEVNTNLSGATTESEKQAAAAQFAAISAQQALLTGQTVQQQFEWELQKDKAARDADNERIGAEQQAISYADEIYSKVEADSVVAATNRDNSRARVTGVPIGLDYTIIH